MWAFSPGETQGSRHCEAARRPSQPGGRGPATGLRRSLRRLAVTAVVLGVGAGGIGELAAQHFPAQQLPVREAGGAPKEMAGRVTGESVTPAPVAASPASRAEPFGVQTIPLRTGGLRRKWQAVTGLLSEESKVLARCRADRAGCPPAADRFLAVIDKALARDGRARIGEINRAINLVIRPADDLAQHGVADFWASPLTTFAAGAGDCEDYAIAKYVALREAGTAGEDLRLVVVRDDVAREYHAVAAVRFESRWLILDNRQLAMREDAELTGFTPLFLIDDRGVKRLRRPPPAEPAIAAAAMHHGASVRLADNLQRLSRRRLPPT